MAGLLSLIEVYVMAVEKNIKSNLSLIEYMLDKIDEAASRLFDGNILSVSRLFEIRDLLEQMRENLKRIGEILGEALEG